MKRLLCLLLACALLSGCSAGGGGSSLEASHCPEPLPPSILWRQTEAPSVSPKSSEAVNTALASFGLELLKQTRAVNGEKAMERDWDHIPFSTLVSPLSAALALSMAANGAAGETLSQFREVLGGGADLEELNRACAQFMFDYQGLRGSSQCQITNSLWVDCGTDLFQEFAARCRGYYSAQLIGAELSEDRVVDDINRWISDKTGGLIPSLIDHPFDEDTALVLVNALYLKSQWALEFEPLSTRQMDFHHAGGPDSRPEYLQHFDTTLSYLRGEGAQGVVLPYDDGRLAFFALLPDVYTDAAYRSFGDWLNTLDGDSLSRLIDSREDAMFLRLALPKFEADWKGDLSEALSGMGLRDAFDPSKADFSSMGSNPDGYYIDQVIHAAKIEVNEKGTEAAAATAAVMEPSASLPPEDGVTLVLDRAFLYGIVDLQTGVPLFLGTYE